MTVRASARSGPSAGDAPRPSGSPDDSPRSLVPPQAARACRVVSSRCPTSSQGSGNGTARADRDRNAGRGPHRDLRGRRAAEGDLGEHPDYAHHPGCQGAGGLRGTLAATAVLDAPLTELVRLKIARLNACRY